MATITRKQSQDETLKRTRSFGFKNLPFAEVHLTNASTKQTHQPTTTTANIRNRPVLLPIHTNIRPIRRLPSRSRMPSALFNRTPRSGSSYASSPRSPAVDAMDEDSQPSSRKRKRGTGNENIDSNGGGLVNKSPLKRSKSAYASLGKGRAPSNHNMAVDEPPTRRATVVVEKRREEPEYVPDEDEETEPEDGPIDSSDDHYVSSAPPWQLRRLKKEDLLRIYGLAGLSSVGDVGEDLTKTDLITAIIRARKNSKGSASSPRTKTASTRSPPSSAANTDGNDAGAEESDALENDDDLRRARKLRRSATTHANLGPGLPTGQLKKSRSINFREVTDQLEDGETSSRRTRFNADQKKGAETRRRTSGQTSHRSSPSSPGPSAENGFYSVKNLSPRHTRLRQSSKTALDPKGKGKHVEFSDDTDVTEDESQPSTADEADNPKDEDWEDEEATPKKSRMPRDREMATPTKRSGTFKRQASLTRTQSKMRVFSPKKLRSRTSKTNLAVDGDEPTSANLSLRRSSSSRQNLSRRVKPSRSFREPDSEDDNRDFPPDEEVIEENEDEEVDELMDEDTQPTLQATQLEDESSDLTDLSSAESSDLTEMSDDDDNYGDQAEESPAPEETPKPTRTRSRNVSQSKLSEGSSRSRKRSGQDAAVAALPLTRRASRRKLKSPSPEVEEEPEEDEVLESAADEDVEAEAGDEEAEEVEPRVLRNGKVVGVADEEEEDQIDEDESTGEAEVMEEDADAELVEEAEDDDEGMEGDFDLTEATAKSLIKLRRDDLVRLCEARDLEPEGTKTQLVSNLLQWRDQVAQAPSSSTQPSSRASTVRAPSTYRGHQHQDVLLRSNRVHVNQPDSPDPDPDHEEIVLIGSKGKHHEGGDELELDLESLGLEDREIPIEKLTKLEKIGSGGFKDVYIGKLRNRKVAIAEFRGHLGPMDIKELKLLADFNHPNVVRFLGISIPEDTKTTPVMMVSELCTNGDLFDYIRNEKPPTLRKLLNLMLDIARGLDYLHNIHKPSVIHRDCKSSNILITGKVTAKIADFGLAKVKQSTRSMVKSLVGTVNWQAPELWHAHPKYDHKVDVFSCAMVFWEMLQWHNPSKKYPWEGMNEHAIYEEVGAKKNRPSLTGCRKLWCPEIVDLVMRMWAQDPKQRPPIREVVEELESIIANL